MSYPQIEIGMKFKWILNPENYRVAIQTTDGVLQVKSVVDGMEDVHTNCICATCQRCTTGLQTRLPLIKTRFDDYISWHNSLPDGGKISISLPEEQLSIQKRTMVPRDLTDYEKVEALQRNFNLRSFVFKNISPREKMENLFDNLRNLTYDYIDGSYMPGAEETKILKKNLQKARRAYRKQAEFVQTCTDEQANQVTYKFYQRGTGRLLVRCGGNMYNITTHDGSICRDDGKGFNNFAEMGADIGESGSPVLYVKYRGKYVTA